MTVASSSSSEGGHVDRINEVPDVMQMDPAGDLPFGGSYSCAPVSAANYLVWLAENGYPDLAPPAHGEVQRVLDLVGVQTPPPQGGYDNGVSRHLDAQNGELKDPDQDQDTQQLHAAGGRADASAGHHRQDQHPLGLRFHAADIHCRESRAGLSAECLQRRIRGRRLA